METPAAVFRVEGPVQVEVFMLWLAGDHLELTGPCGADPWLIEAADDEHPVEVVTRMVRDVVGDPILVHSTSWRREQAAVILTFLVVVDESLVGSMATQPVLRTELARGTATAAPSTIASASVVEHGLRHMAWLAKEDPIVASALSEGWRTALARYVPEPFRNLG